MSGRTQPIEDLPALVSQLLRDLTDRRYLGRTTARDRHDTAIPYALWPSWSQHAGSPHDPRLDASGMPLAYSCWEISVAFAERLHSQGVHASVHLAEPDEEGAKFEPHAVVIYTEEAGDPVYLADPYFDVPALCIKPAGDFGYVHVEHDAVTSRHGDAAVDVPRPAWGPEPQRPTLLTVHHLTYPKAYRYRVGERALHLPEFQQLVREAPAWVGPEGIRALRVTIDDLVVRVTERQHGFETRVWVTDASTGSGPAFRPWSDVTSPVHGGRTADVERHDDDWVRAVRRVNQLAATRPGTLVGTAARTAALRILEEATS